ncbi:MAG: methionyl-tRNA formyltransferase [Gammaproteobacteria bacterium]|nr:methionyl-tRNA formyltransferase [Gammaproteobacteria bacterium]
MTEKLKVGYFADGPWSHAALEALLQRGLCEIAFIVPRFDTQDPVLKQYAEHLSVPFIPQENVNDAEFITRLQGYGADLFVSMSFNQILRKPIIDTAPLGFINCHAGALPFYRGRNPLNWVLINDESYFGVTAHYVDEGIDTGDIIIQHKVDISEQDDYASLLEKAFVKCSEVLVEAVELISGGKVNRIKQNDINPYGFYCGMRRVGDEVIDWQLPARRIHNLVRAITLPGPAARTVLKGKEVAIIKSRFLQDAPSYICTPGEVVGRDESGVYVKAGDSVLHILEVANVSQEGALEQFETPGYRIGTRFGGVIEANGAA